MVGYPAPLERQETGNNWMLEQIPVLFRTRHIPSNKIIIQFFKTGTTI